MDSRLQHASCPLLNPCIAQTEGTLLLESVELFGMAALHTLALMAGVNKSKEGNAYEQKNKPKTEGGVLCSNYRRWMLTRSFMNPKVV